MAKKSTKTKTHGRVARGTSERFDISRLKAELKPFRLHWFPTLRSTNDHAAVLRRRGSLFCPAVVLTGKQTAGRGRGSHVWFSAGGCITVTFALPIHDFHQPHHIPLLAGLAVRAAAAEALNDDSVQLKWPNDVLHEGKKLAGLLCERIDRADLVGIGLNVNLDPAQAPPDIRERVTSLSDIAGGKFDLTTVAALLAKHLNALLNTRPDHPMSYFLEKYDEHHALIGREVSVLTGDAGAVTGICRGLDSTGRLLLKDGTTTHRVISGQVMFKR